MQIDYERLAVLSELLARPDDPEMPPRSHSLTVEGKPDRYRRIHRLRAMAAEYARHKETVQ